MTKVSKLAKMLRPHLAQAQDAGGGGGMSVHELSGPLHTGVLSQSQAPWAATQTSLLAHINDPAAHHEPVSAGNLIDVLGQTVGVQAGSAGHQVMMTNPTTFAAEWRNLSSLAGNGLQTSDGQLLVGAGPGLTVTSTAVGLTTPGTLSVSSANSASGSHTHAISSSSNPGATASLLATDASGHLTLVRLTATDRLRTTLLDSASGQSLTVSPALDLILSPASGLVRMATGRALQASSYASQTTGWRITDAGEGDFRYLFADELHAKSFIADLEQALAGGQIIAKSVAVVATDFTLPAAGSSATLRVRDLPSAPNMAVFQSGDFVGLRQFSRSGGELVVAWAWGTVSNYADGTGAWEGTQTWTFTRHSSTPGSASGVIPADALALDFGTSGNGYYEVNAVDGLYGQNSPYAQVVTWSGHPATRTVRARFGNLRGITNVTGEFGLFAGSGTGVSDRYIRASSSAVELRNVPLQLFDGAAMTMQLSAGAGNNAPSFAMGSPLPTAPLSNDSGAWMGLSGGQYQFRVGSVSGGTLQQGLHWDGSSLRVVGQITVLGGSGGYMNLADRPTSLVNINAQEYAQLATGQTIFNETFDGVDPLSQWTPVVSGAGEMNVVTTANAVTGGKLLRVGDNSGDDQRYLVHSRLIPFNPNKLYKFTLRVRNEAGTGKVFAGFVGVAADGVTLVNVSGANTYNSQHYFCALNQQPGASWTEYVGYVQGWGATQGQYGTPNKAHPGVRYMRPALIVNNPNVSGICRVDMYRWEEYDWPSSPGLYLTPIYSGYWDGNAWRTYFDQNGNFYLNSGASNNFLQWNGSSLTINGVINATSGSIGGWSIGATQLTGGNVQLDSAGRIAVGTGSNVVWLDATHSTHRLWAGASSPGSAPFAVSTAGALTATNATITGAITATSGSIAGVLTIGTSGEIRQGTGTLGFDFTGLRILQSSGIGQIALHKNNYKITNLSVDGIRSWMSDVPNDLSPGIKWMSNVDATGDFYTLTTQPGNWAWLTASLSSTHTDLKMTSRVVSTSAQPNSRHARLLLSAERVDDGGGQTALFAIVQTDASSGYTGLFQFFGGALHIGAISTPSTTLSANNQIHVYLRNGNLIIRYNDNGTYRYKYLPLAGTGTTWVHSTTPP